MYLTQNFGTSCSKGSIWGKNENFIFFYLMCIVTLCCGHSYNNSYIMWKRSIGCGCNELIHYKAAAIHAAACTVHL